MCYNIYAESKSASDITPEKGETLMATKKNFHYVLVFTDEGPVYVTSCNNATNYARWDKSEAPKDFPKYYAEEIAFGLRCNFHQAVMVTTKVELDCQPYNYKKWDCKFEKKEVSEDD